LLVKHEDENGVEKQRLVGFKTVHVFDLSQTSGQPLPPVPDWKSPQKNEELNCKLIQFAENHGILVTFKNLPLEIQGMSRGGSVDIDLTAGTKTLIHEISHELLHRAEFVSNSYVIREVEAESVAYVVCSYFGMSNLASPNYLALHDSRGEMIIARLQRISDLASDLILALEGMNK